MTSIPLRLALPVAGAALGVAMAVFVDDNDLTTLPILAQIGLGYLILGLAICFLLLAGPLPVRQAFLTALGISGVATAAMIASTLYLAPEDYRTLLIPDRSNVYYLAFLLFCLTAVPLVLRRFLAGSDWLEPCALYDCCAGLAVRAIIALVAGALATLPVIFAIEGMMEAMGVAAYQIDFLGVIVSICIFAAAGLVLSFAVEEDRLLDGLRRIGLGIARILMLPLAVLMIAQIVLWLVGEGSDLDFRYSAASLQTTLLLAGVLIQFTALGKAQEGSPMSMPILWSFRLFSVVLPVFGGFLIHALRRYAEQMGWTPDLFGAAALIGVATGLAAVLALRILTAGPDPRDALRRLLAPFLLAGSAAALIWLTPVVTAEALASRAQVAAYKRGDLDLSDLGLWEARYQWGAPGRRMVDELNEISTNSPKLAEALKRLTSEDEWAHLRHTEEERAAESVRILAAVPVLPPGAGLPADLTADKLADESLFLILHEACRIELDDGGPGCLAIVGDFAPMLPGEEVAFLRVVEYGWDSSGYIAYRSGGRWQLEPQQMGAVLSGDHLVALRQNGFELVPQATLGLRLGERTYFMLPTFVEGGGEEN